MHTPTQPLQVFLTFIVSVGAKSFFLLREVTTNEEVKNYFSTSVLQYPTVFCIPLAPFLVFCC